MRRAVLCVLDLAAILVATATPPGVVVSAAPSAPSVSGAMTVDDTGAGHRATPLARVAPQVREASSARESGRAFGRILVLVGIVVLVVWLVRRSKR